MIEPFSEINNIIKHRHLMYTFIFIFFILYSTYNYHCVHCVNYVHGKYKYGSVNNTFIIIIIIFAKVYFLSN